MKVRNNTLKDRSASILAFLTIVQSILQILTYISEYISETTTSMVIVPHDSLTIFLYSKAPNNCGTWNSKGQLGCSSWTAEKPGPAKWKAALVLFTGQTKAMSYSCYVTGGKAQASEALRGNSRGGLSKTFQTGHPFQTQPYQALSILPLVF